MWKLNVLFAFLVSLSITSYVIPKILLISFKKRLFDFADERKVHTGIVPRLGGVAFTPSIIITYSCLFGINCIVVGLFSNSQMFHSPFIPMILGSLLILYLEGITDDLIGLRYRGKFILQTFCAVLLTASGLWIDDFSGLFGIHAVPAFLGIPFSVLLIVFIINAINLIDGIDGLASGLSGIASLFFGLFFFYEQDWAFAILAFTLLGTLVPFFYFNVFGSAERGKKIFMGDTGSQTVGLILAILAIRLSTPVASESPHIPGAVVMAFSLLLTPIFDVLRVIIHRTRNHRNPFLPDRSHIHHKFLALGFSHRRAMVTILLISSGFAILNIFLISRLNITLILIVDITLWTLMNIGISRKIKKSGGNFE